uniref:Uncharacterized protein n=1 Tax=Triticum aestivum TaxID=4565 RepID=A0A077RSG2_WHEAT|nr:unnamed protein product [Triticum aestivum]
MELKEVVVRQNLPAGEEVQGLPQRFVSSSLLQVSNADLVVQDVIELPPKVIVVLGAVHAGGLKENDVMEGGDEMNLIRVYPSPWRPSDTDLIAAFRDADFFKTRRMYGPKHDDDPGWEFDYILDSEIRITTESSEPDTTS